MTKKNHIHRALATTAIAGVAFAGIGIAAANPAAAADEKPASSSSSYSGSGNVNVNFDPVAIVDSIVAAVNDQDDRSGAVKAATEVGYYSKDNPDRMSVAVVNKNQDIQVSGEIADAKNIDIKGGNYVIYWFSGPGQVVNNGDGGWLNWGTYGNIERADDNLIKINGGL
ncbi:hypothetical protein HMPREF0183_2197 [Brevibacterium mcbrellneri ATCC 49030]|uniref:Tat pathway signal sequence domain protein n=1 Tax=Brevibacterium mcbrellneri ATCC 49030 TaxID=585530 RepID=D4YQI7_9MICO|nr:hypothetical protein [Brevibacterium mcbrellneri]EFG46475.1 hypothetical protein HMPREF0183_2197 [Brevibacterium mcbrellneri ATCC 49030]